MRRRDFRSLVLLLVFAGSLAPAPSAEGRERVRPVPLTVPAEARTAPAPGASTNPGTTSVVASAGTTSVLLPESRLPNPEHTYSSPFDTTWALVQLSVALVFVVALIFFLRVVLKKTRFRFQSGPIRVVDAAPIAYDKQVMVIEVYGHFYVVGVSAAGISLVSELTDEPTRDRLKVLLKREGGGSFADTLRGISPDPGA